jgi:Trypsin-like peptidase domain
MTEPLHDPSAAHVRELLARRRAGFLESTGAEAGPPPPDDIADRIEDTLSRIPAEEISDPKEFRQALDTLLRETRRATHTLASAGQLSPGELNALEAVVHTDGTRPTLLVRDDSYDPQHPLAGDWAGALTDIHADVGVIAKAVGRIEPVNGTAHSYFGTGWVIDTDGGLILTNLHVLEKIWQTFPDVVVRAGNDFQILDSVYIDFAAEAGRTRTDRFRVVQATPSGVNGSGYARLDAAVMRIEPIEENQQIPQALAALPDNNGPLGNLDAVYVIGFPGPPAFFGGVNDGVNWRKIYRALFGNLYGVKRFAPGIVHKPLGTLTGDTRRWVFGHDATTLGGSSGSPIVGFVDGKLAAFGLHFAGASEVTNSAHALSAGAEELRAIGVPLPVPN